MNMLIFLLLSRMSSDVVLFHKFTFYSLDEFLVKYNSNPLGEPVSYFFFLTNWYINIYL